MNWLWHIALSKLLKRLILILVAWVIGHDLGRYGVSIDPVKLSAAIWALLEWCRGWLKMKFNLKWL